MPTKLDGSRVVCWTLTDEAGEVNDSKALIAMTLARKHLRRKGVNVLHCIVTYDEDEVGDDEELSEFVFKRTGMRTSWRSDHFEDLLDDWNVATGEALESRKASTN